MSNISDLNRNVKHFNLFFIRLTYPVLPGEKREQYRLQISSVLPLSLPPRRAHPWLVCYSFALQFRIALPLTATLCPSFSHISVLIRDRMTDRPMTFWGI